MITNYKWIRRVSLIAVSLALPAGLAFAKVNIAIEGVSNGDALYAWKGPSGINTTIKATESGGSISSASASAVFHKYKVQLANQVVSAGTDGDADYTHVRAGSTFYGKAKFIAHKKGARVKNFKINYKMSGNLKCYVPDESVPEGYAIADVETQVRFNGADRFVGTATVDGRGGFDSGTSDLAGQFDGDMYNVSIDKTFPVNLGTLKDGKKYSMLFFGATLVSYGADVPIDYCAADFMKTSDFTVPEDTQEKKGTMEYTPATPVDPTFDPQPWSLSLISEMTVYVESQNEDLLNSIDVNTVQLFERLGDSGQIQPTGINDTGDFDEDGIPDRGITFDGLQLWGILDLPYLGLRDSVKLYLIGDTEEGIPFAGIGTFETEQ